MLGRLWQQLVRLFQYWFHLLQTGKPKPTEPYPEITPMSDVAYELLFMRILDRVEWGWDQSQVLAHLGRRARDHFFESWLQRFGRDRLLASPLPNHELGRRMVKLGKIGCGEIGEIAQEFGQQLLEREELKLPETEPTNHTAIPADQPTGPLGDADRAEDTAEAWLSQGLVLQNSEHWEEGLASFDHALELRSDFYEAWYNRGNALFDLERLAEAITSYDRALSLEPGKYQAWNNRGNALAELGCFEAAIASYDHAIEIKPDDYQPWYNRSVALRNLGRLAEASESYNQAVSINPSLTQHNLGRL